MWLLFGDLSKAGPAGDTFGSITSLFTGFAFVGLIATLILQQKELRLQRRELRLQRSEVASTREELAGQKEQMQLQNQSLTQQMFEQTFFNMLRVLIDYINDISGPPNRDTGAARTGRDQLGTLVARSIRNDGLNEQTALNYIKLYDANVDDLGGYFRLIYNILKFVDQSAVNDKSKYTNILRAQLSESELVLLSCNVCTPVAEKAVPLIEKYNMLKHAPRNYHKTSLEEVWNILRNMDYPPESKAAGL